MALQTTWFVAFGIQAVLFPYLVVHVLGESPERVGVAQMCMMAPALLLMLPGGMLADASDLRRLMARLQWLTALPVSLLALALGRGEIAFGALIVFALAHGSLQAMIVPTRDALLGRVAGSQVQRAITTAMAVQFLCQMLGFALAGSADILGPSTLLALQGGLYLAGGAIALSLRSLPPLDDTLARKGPCSERSALARARSHLAALPAVFHEVANSPRIGPVSLVMMGVGLFFISVFSVVVPVMVRDIYHGDSGALAMVNASFVLGVLLITLIMRGRPAVHHQGRVIVGCAGAGSILTAGFALAPPIVWFYAIILAFGAVAGVIMSLGRTLVQEGASPGRRARVLALYSLGYLGAAPIGSFLVGQTAERIGILPTAVLAGIAMAALLVAVAARSNILALERPTGE